MQELFLHHVWRLSTFDWMDLRTTGGQEVHIIKRGSWNQNAGPDFLHARIQIGSETWEGHVEIHLRASDWTAHKHEDDPAYNSVILHVVLEEDQIVYTQDGRRMPTIELQDRIPAGLISRLSHLVYSLEEIPCHKSIHQVASLKKINWIERLAVERLSRKGRDIVSLYHSSSQHWEQTVFKLWCKYAGGKVNQAAFIRLGEVAKVSHLWQMNHFQYQLEAYLFGCAGLLPIASKEVYPSLLLREFALLQKKWDVIPMKKVEWRFFRMRPANFPTIRIAQLASLYQHRSRWIPFLLEASTKELVDELQVVPSPYWQTHYLFGRKSEKAGTSIGISQIHKFLINIVAPLRIAYSMIHEDPQAQQAAMHLLESLPSESNRIVKRWKKVGLKPQNALHSQGCIELKTNWCDQKACLTCAIGNDFLAQPHPVQIVEEALISTIMQEPLSERLTSHGKVK